MKLSDYVAEALVQNGVKCVFLLPGGGCMHLCDSVGQRSELEFVCCLHEQGCAFATEAYGAYNNTIGVCLVTAGPGGTNSITGVACAWIESTPCLFISGQVKRADLIGERGVRSMGPQEIDIVSVVAPITKYAVRLLDPLKVRMELEKAFYTAREGRPGPVWIDIPLDVQAADIDPAALKPFVPPRLVIGKNVESSLRVFLEALKKAKRPVIYCGNGVRISGALPAFKRLIDTTGIPVLLSWKAADFLPEDHPCYVGRPGAIGQRAANLIQQKADWLFVIGARLDLPSVAFSHAGLAPRALKAFVDIDHAESNKFSPPPDFSICEDARVVIESVEEILKEGFDLELSNWRKECECLKRRFPMILPGHLSCQTGISTYALIDRLCEIAISTDLIVPGSSGSCSDILMQAWRVKDGQRILNAPGLGAMGTGIPGALGACLASGRRRTINVNGDGGFQLNIQELETVRRLSLPIKYFVLDNGGYRSIVSMQRNHFKGRLVGSDSSSGLTLPSVDEVARAYGIKTFSASTLQELQTILPLALNSLGPVVCIIKTAVDESTTPRCLSQLKPDGTLITKPMEDMWPFLDPDELSVIMANS